MFLVFLVPFLLIPFLVWRFFRARRLAWIVIFLWLGPVLYMVGFDLAMSDCANVPYTALGGYLDCPTKTHELAYAVFGPLASLLFIGVFSHGLASIGLYLMPLAAGIVADAYLRRRRG